MAHHTGGNEVEYYVHNDVQIMKILHHNEIKQEPDMNIVSSGAPNTYVQQSSGSVTYHNHNHQQQQSQQQNPNQFKKEPIAGSSSSYYEQQQQQHHQNQHHQMQISVNGQQQQQQYSTRLPYTIKTENNTPYTVLPTQPASTSGRSLLKSNNAKQMLVRQPPGSTSSSSKTKPPALYTVASSTARRRKTDKIGRGLRHFSKRVCAKVQEKGTTTYNEVADELVREEQEEHSNDSNTTYDQKNIRRRVYDALNVLMAMNIISKDKKEIQWIGLPTNDTSSEEEFIALEKENEKRRQNIEIKEQKLKELLIQHISYKNLIHRNQETERNGIIPAPNSSIQLPFIIVNTHKATKINCSVSSDKSEYFFEFNDKFEIHDDIEVLQKMGLAMGLDRGECTAQDIQKAKLFVPKKFEKYIDQFGSDKNDEELLDSLSSSQSNLSTQTSLLTSTTTTQQSTATTHEWDWETFNDQSSDSRTIEHSSIRDDDMDDQISENSDFDHK